MAEQDDSPKARPDLTASKQALLEKWRRGNFTGVSRAQAIPRCSRTQPIPLSFAQQRLWFLEQLLPGNTAYTIYSAFRLKGTLHVAALEDSINAIIRRHESLRTTFASVDEQPVQVIQPELCLHLTPDNLEDLSEAARERETRRIIMEEVQRSFDLVRGPLFRARLLRLAPNEHTLLLSMHHSISDGWSLGVLLRELTILYAAYVEGKSSPLPDLPIQYVDFAVWQRQWLQGHVLETQLAYWKRQLAGAPPLLTLPTDHVRPPVPTFRGAEHIFKLSQTVLASLKAFARAERVTLFQVLLTAFQILLARYAGQEDIVVGTPIAGRVRTETEPLIGFFANTLALRTDLSGDPTVRELLQRVRTTTLDAYAHQELPFEQVVTAIQPEREMSHNPLFQVMLVLQSEPLEEPSLSGLSIGPQDLAHQTTLFDLWLSMEEKPDGLAAILQYATDLFEHSTMERLSRHYQTILTQLVANPEQHLSAISLLTLAEREQILYVWNATHTVYPLKFRLHELFELQVERTPTALAVVFEGMSLTYRELEQRATQLAGSLQQRGVGPETLVGVCMERSLELVIGLLAILKAGGAYLPLDPDYPRKRLHFMLQDAHVFVVLTQERLRACLPEYGLTILCLDSANQCWQVDDYEAAWQPSPQASPDNLAYMIYTSGSTGQPKGTMLTHRGVCNRLLWMQERYGLGTTDRVLQKTPFTFDVSVWEFFWPLLAGACLVLARPDGHRESAYLAALIEAEQITTVHFVPSMLDIFLQERNITRCPSLRYVICSGEALPLAYQERFFAKLSAELHNLYGPTEASIDVTSWHCDPTDARRVVPIGHPIANTQIFLLDAHYNPVPIGIPGEIFIGGFGLARGYFNRADLTAERFIPHPWSKEPGARLYRTGDLARYLPDGSIDFLGRIDSQVKLHGLRIELGEIEAVLRQHPVVQETVVVVHEGLAQVQSLVAYVVPVAEQLTNDTQAIPTLLQHYLQERLPEYMVPQTFVVLNKLPLASNGKVNRRALPAPRAAVPDFVAPRTPIEETLAHIWMEVLGLESIGVHTNFFEAGGDSIQSIRVISRAVEAGLHITPRQMFQHRTIAELATVALPIPHEQKSTGAIGVPATPQSSQSHAEDFSLIDQSLKERIMRTYPDVEDAYPATPFQEYILRYQLATPRPGIYVIHQIGILQEEWVNVPAFQRAWQEIINRHTALRTSFLWQNLAWPLQLVHRHVPLNFELLDWRDLSSAEQEERSVAYVREKRAQGFDLAQAPQSQFTLMQLDERTYKFFWSFNHMLQEGWSYPLILKDFFALYDAYKRGENLILEKSRPFRDYIAWIQRQDQAKAEAFWRQELQGFTKPTSILQCAPGNRPEAQGDYTFEDHLLPNALTTALRALTRQQQVTLNTLVQGCWALLLSAYTGETDVLFGGIVSGRAADVPGVEYIVGYFNNMLPIRVQIQPDMPLLTWLQALQAKQVEARQYEYSSLTNIRALSAVPAHLPLFDSYVVFENFPTDATVTERQQNWLRERSALTQTEHPLRIEIWPMRSLLFAAGYYPTYFDAATIQRILSDMQCVLEIFVTAPHQRLADVLHLVTPSKE